jgi:dTDP-4-amino-4,6-dideoxygalactose transaminase
MFAEQNGHVDASGNGHAATARNGHAPPQRNGRALAERDGNAPIVFGAPLIGDDDILEVVDTLRSGWIGTGPKTARFEQEFAHFVGARYAVATNSCTAAMHLALKALGVGPGDEVITSPMTFVATLNAIEHCGATPVLADVRADDGTIDPDAVARRVTARTSAIIPVHYAGRVAAVPEIRRNHPDIPVLVDAAHAVEARYADGSSSAAGATCTAYSFYVTKNLTTGEGGMLVTDDEALAADARIRRLHGLDHDAWKRYANGALGSYDLEFPGFKYNMTDIQAALGIHQLRRLLASRARRRAIWERYNEAFANVPGVTIPPAAMAPEDGAWHALHLYALWIDWKEAGVTRAEFVARMRGLGVGTGWHFPAVHLQRYYREHYGYAPGSYPVAESIGRRTISLPMSPALNDEQVDRVIAAVPVVLRPPALSHAQGA